MAATAPTPPGAAATAAAFPAPTPTILAAAPANSTVRTEYHLSYCYGNANHLQYLQHNAIKLEIESLRQDTSESHMYGIWDAILNYKFPVASGYITRPQDLHRTYGGSRGFSDFHTMERLKGDRKFFLLTQCKAAASESQEADWNRAVQQLKDYFKLQHKKRPAGTVYGIVAVGKRVSFYQFDFQNKEAVLWLPRSLPPMRGHTGNRDWYQLDKEHCEVEACLNYILQNH